MTRVLGVEVLVTKKSEVRRFSAKANIRKHSGIPKKYQHG
jgi:hypothetical protein